uniref:Transposase n=1 Tax=Heterorhabditis bacteriophora TaxID=37862 RepID=A0A1I7WZL5_HETBA
MLVGKRPMNVPAYYMNSYFLTDLDDKCIIFEQYFVVCVCINEDKQRRLPGYLRTLSSPSKHQDLTEERWPGYAGLVLVLFGYRFNGESLGDSRERESYRQRDSLNANQLLLLHMLSGEIKNIHERSLEYYK